MGSRTPFRCLVVAAVACGLAMVAQAAPVGQWQFDGSLNDAIGAAHGSWFDNGAPATAVYGTGRDGTANGALVVDGSTNDYAEMNVAGAGADLSAFTMAGWVKTSTSPPAWSSWWGVDAATLRNEVRDDLGTPQSYTDGIGGEGRIENWTFAPNIRDDQWHHIASVYSEADNVSRIYLDGRWVGSRNTWTQTTPVNALRVGRSWSWQAQSTNSLIDDMSVWNHALTEHEINQLYQGAAPAAVTSAPPETPLMVIDFEGGLPPGVTVTGSAFTGQPTTSLRHDFYPHGSHFIGTYEDGRGDAATGEIVSDGFVLPANTMRMRVGGGHHTDTALQLQRWNGTDWVTVRTELGHSRAEVGTTPQVGERMSERLWNVGNLVGETVRLRGLDTNTGSWGHINFDYIRLLDEARPTTVQTDFDQPTLPPELSTYIPLRGGLGREAKAALNAPNSTFDFDIEPSGGLNYDLWATADRAPQLRMPVAANDQCWTLETHMSARTIAGNANSSTGLILDYVDRQNGNKDMFTFGPYMDNGLVAESPTFYRGLMDLPGQTVDDVHLRVENRYGDYRFSYSLDGTTWVRMGDRRNSNDLLYAGLYAKTWSAAAAQSSQFDTLAFESLKRSDLLQRVTFEDGLPAGWTTTGTAFNNQPTASTRTEFYKQGERFLGTYEDGNGDGAVGVLTGTPFVAQGNTIRALVGGGGHDSFGSETQLQLERQMGDGSWRVVRSDSGYFGNAMREVAWNVGDLAGQTVRFSVADNNAGGWGQVIVDDIRELDERRPTYVRDDFDNDITSPDLMVYRPYASPGAETTATGTFRFDLPGGGYDLWSTVNRAPQLQLAVSPEDLVWAAETRVSARALTGADVNAATGLILNFGDLANGNKDPVMYGAYRDDGLCAEGPFFGYNALRGLTGTMVDDIHLRVLADHGYYTFSYSADGASWTTLGSRPYGSDITSVGLFAKSWGGDSGQTSELDYFEFQSIKRAPLLQRWDFEDDQFPAGWTTTGTAFGNQPTASNRSWGGQAGLAKQGEFFIGTWEDGNGDGATGELISQPFEVTGNTMYLKIGGGYHVWQPGATDYTAVLLEREVSPGTWEVIRDDSGHNSEIMREHMWNLSGLEGQTVRLRVADLNTGGWGHINVDDIRITNEARPIAYHTDFSGPYIDGALFFRAPSGTPTASIVNGKARIHLDDAAYDHWRFVDNAPALLLPLGPPLVAAETSLSLDYTGGTAFHTGLSVVFSNYDGLFWGPYRDAGLRLEIPGLGAQLIALSGLVDDVDLKVLALGDDYEFLYRLPGDADWTSAGTYTHPGDPLYVGLFAKSWGGHPTSLDVDFDYLGVVVIPEPATLTLLCLGGLGLLVRRRRN